MSYSWIRVVDPITQQPVVIEQLIRLRQSLDKALNKRDWPLVCQIDRLCGQVVKVLDSSNQMPQVIQELKIIKQLYQQSLVAIEVELNELSNQAY